MSSIYDEIYLDKISSGLELFSKKGSNAWACRCPYCGDSKKNKRITRGFFHYGYEKNLIFSCRNCGVAVPLVAFLHDHFPQYATQYKLDTLFKSTKITFKKPEVRKPPKKDYINILPKKSYVPLIQLPDSHEAKLYMASRGVYQLDRFGYAENFSRFVDEQTDADERYARVPKDKRIIIPINSPTGEQWGFQGRALSDSNLRYVTIKQSENFVKVFGLDKFDKNKAGFIVEGPIDSTFLPNTVSMCGSSLDRMAIEMGYIIPQNTIIIYDNEPRNEAIVNQMKEMAKIGFRIHVPRKTQDTRIKDINKMVQAGWSQLDMVQYFIENSYKGLRAQLEINNWKL